MKRITIIMLVVLLVMGSMPVMAGEIIIEDDVVQPIESVVYYDQSGYESFIESLSEVDVVVNMFPQLDGKLVGDEDYSVMQDGSGISVAGVYTYEDEYGNILNVDVNEDGTYSTHGIYIGIPVDPDTVDLNATGVRMGSEVIADGYRTITGATAYWNDIFISIPAGEMSFQFDVMREQMTGYTIIKRVYNGYHTTQCLGTSAFVGGTESLFLASDKSYGQYSCDILVGPGEYIDSSSIPTEPIGSGTLGRLYLRMTANQNNLQYLANLSYWGNPY